MGNVRGSGIRVVVTAAERYVPSGLRAAIVRPSAVIRSGRGHRRCRHRGHLPLRTEYASESGENRGRITHRSSFIDDVSGLPRLNLLRSGRPATRTCGPSERTDPPPTRVPPSVSRTSHTRRVPHRWVGTQFSATTASMYDNASSSETASPYLASTSNRLLSSTCSDRSTTQSRITDTR